MKLFASVKTQFDGVTLADLAEWLDQLESFGLGVHDVFIDTGRIQPTGHPELSLDDWALERHPETALVTRGDAREWVISCYEHGLAPDVVLDDRDGLFVELRRGAVELIDCGDCAPQNFFHDVLVTTHRCTALTGDGTHGFAA